MAGFHSTRTPNLLTHSAPSTSIPWGAAECQEQTSTQTAQTALCTGEDEPRHACKIYNRAGGEGLQAKRSRSFREQEDAGSPPGGGGAYAGPW